MPKEIADKYRSLNSRQRILAIGVATGLTVLVVLLVGRAAAPAHTVAAYCRTFQQEKARLAKVPGETYESGVFDDSLSDAGEYAASFGKLERVAPSDIQPDIRTLRSVYQKIHDNPSQALSASLSGGPAEESVKAWTKDNCNTGQTQPS
jgi:hypothetical protein